jgi:hypothetical protein
MAVQRWRARIDSPPSTSGSGLPDEQTGDAAADERVDIDRRPATKQFKA